MANVKKKIEKFDGIVLFTRDTHGSDYLDTQEGKNLPIPHCIKGTEGWEIRAELEALRTTDAIDKVTFGSSELGQILLDLNETEKIAKAFLPEVPIIVDANCCAGVSVKTHENALSAREVCQVKITR